MIDEYKAMRTPSDQEAPSPNDSMSLAGSVQSQEVGCVRPRALSSLPTLLSNICPRRFAERLRSDIVHACSRQQAPYDLSDV